MGALLSKVLGGKPKRKEPRLDVIIVGAGLGGLGAAISCVQASGSRVRVRVLEQSKFISEVGAGLQITPNGSRLLRRWEIPSTFWETVAEPSALYIHRYSGEVLFVEDDYGKEMQKRYGYPFVDVHRADLQQALYARAQELGVEFLLGQKVIDVDTKGMSGGKAVVKTATSTYTADLLVGADGLWSQCRASVLGNKAHPRPTGDLAYRIVLTTNDIPDEDLREWVRHPTVRFWIGPGSHAVGYSLKAGEMYNIVLLSPDTLPEKVSKDAGNVDEMRNLFSQWDPVLKRFLGYVNTVDKWKLMHCKSRPDITGRAWAAKEQMAKKMLHSEVDELPHWISDEGNLVFLGDACHPMLPYLAQGANSSLEDGAVLGTLLGHVQKRTDLKDMLQRYEKLRKKRGEAIVRETFNQRNDFHMPDGEEADERNKKLRAGLHFDPPEAFPSRWNCPKVQPWLYGYDAISAAEEALKE